MFPGLARDDSVLVPLHCQMQFERFFLITDALLWRNGSTERALKAPGTHRCHGKVLSPNVDYSRPCPPACAATSCRQEPHIQGQILPQGGVLTQQMLSYGLGYILSSHAQTVWFHVCAS